MIRRILVARLDGAGNVLLAGPAVRAAAAAPDAEETLLCGPQGEAAGRLLPGVRRVLVWASPWAVHPAPPVDGPELGRVVAKLAGHAFDDAVLLTSFHQSPLPTALLLRLAGVTRITGAALLDVRLRPGNGPGEDLPEDLPEPERALAIAAAAGFRLPAGDDGKLAVGRPPPVGALLGRLARKPYVVLHPGAAVPARCWPVEHHRGAARLLEQLGLPVVVTGGPGERRADRGRRAGPLARPSAAAPTSPSSRACSPEPSRWSPATPAPPTWPPPSAPPWCRGSRRSSRP